MAQEETATEEPRKSRGRTIAIVAAVGVVALVAGFAAWLHYRVRESTDDAQIDGHIHAVAARVGGAVVAVKVEDNQRVEAGTLLVQIDPRDYQVALEKAKADLADATAGAEAARTGVPVTSSNTASRSQTAESEQASAQARLASARARLRETDAKAAKAAQDLERMRSLVAKDEVSRQEYDAAVVGAEAARAERESASSAVKEAEQAIATAAAHVEEARTGPQQVAIVRARASSAEAKVEEARAAVAQAELDLEHTSVKAPVAGIVSKRSAEVGQIVQAGQPLLAVVPLEDVWVTANFKESQLRKMRANQPVDVSVDAYGGQTYRGHVDSLSPATGAKFSLLPSENASGNYVKVVQRVPVKIVFEPGQDPDRKLRPGMSVVATVLTE